MKPFSQKIVAIKNALANEIKNPYRKETLSIAKLCIYKVLLFLKGLVYLVVYRRYRKITSDSLAKLRAKNVKNVFVFANGPSLNDLDFVKIRKLLLGCDWDLITINSFASKAIDEFEISPTFSVFSDPYHYIGNENKELSAQAKEDIEKINQKGICTLAPYHFIKYNQFKNSIPFCSATNIYSNNVSDISKPLGYYPVTAFYAISLALNMRYENIYVCGFDNSYFIDFGVDENNLKYFYDKHFYDSSTLGKRYINNDSFEKTSDVFLNFYRHFKFLEKINCHKNKKVKIRNIAKRTYTDAFERDMSLDIYKANNFTDLK